MTTKCGAMSSTNGLSLKAKVKAKERVKAKAKAARVGAKVSRLPTMQALGLEDGHQTIGAVGETKHRRMSS